MARSVFAFLVVAALACSLALPTLFPIASPAARAVPPEPIGCPDGITSVKAASILQYDAGLIVFIRFPEEWDMNADGHIESTDALLVLQCVAGLIPELPV